MKGGPVNRSAISSTLDAFGAMVRGPARGLKMWQRTAEFLDTSMEGKPLRDAIAQGIALEKILQVVADWKREPPRAKLESAEARMARIQSIAREAMGMKP
jgi:hypothetical protein